VESWECCASTSKDDFLLLPLPILADDFDQVKLALKSWHTRPTSSKQRDADGWDLESRRVAATKMWIEENLTPIMERENWQFLLDLPESA